MEEIKELNGITEVELVEEVNNVIQEIEDVTDVELTEEQKTEINMMDMIKKDLYPTINDEEKEMLEKYDILNTGMAGINKAVEDVYKGELSKFIEQEIEILNTLYTSSPDEIKLRRLVETDKGDIDNKRQSYTNYSLDEQFMNDESNIGVLTYLKEELELANNTIDNYTITVDNVKYYLKDLYLSLMDEKEVDNVYRLFTPNVKLIKEVLLESFKIEDIKEEDEDGNVKPIAEMRKEVGTIDTKIDTYLYLLSFPTKIEVENYTEFTSKYAYVTAIHIIFNEEEVISDFISELGYYKSKYNSKGLNKIDYISNRTSQRHMIKGALKDIHFPHLPGSVPDGSGLHGQSEDNPGSPDAGCILPGHFPLQTYLCCHLPAYFCLVFSRH